MPEHVYDMGDTVLCDLCNRDYTKSNATGGFLFGSKAVCPVCAPNFLETIEKCNEAHYIKEHCPTNMTFREWCLKLRGGDNTIRIISF